MSLTLQDLCADFCAITEAAVPELVEQPEGIVAFSITWREVTVDLMAQPSADPRHAFVIFHMGGFDPAHFDAVPVLQGLLNANFMGLRANQPVFSCNPNTGGLMLQWAVPLEGTSGENLRTILEEGVQLVLHWRGTHLPATVGATRGTHPSANARRERS